MGRELQPEDEVARLITEYYSNDETTYPPADPDEMTHVFKENKVVANPDEDQEPSAAD